MSLADELLQGGRNQILLAEVLTIDDTGEAQTLTVRTHDGVERTGVEVLSPHGLAANAGAGGVALVLAVGGDQGHLVALPVANQGVRYGAMPEGGAGVVDDAANRLVFPGDGTALLTAAGLFRILVQSLQVDAAGGITFNGPVTFTEAVTFNDQVTFAKDVKIGGALKVSGPVTGASFNGRS